VDTTLGYLNLKPEQSNIFFKLMEERYRQHSTIITTNRLCGVPHNRFRTKPLRGIRAVPEFQRKEPALVNQAPPFL
jgi:hypothetical protein